MSKSVYESLKKQIFGGFSPVQLKKQQQKLNQSVQKKQKQQPPLSQRKLNRSRDQNRQKQNRPEQGSIEKKPTTNQSSNTKTILQKNYLLFFLRNLFIDKQRVPFNKITLQSQFVNKIITNKLIELNKFLTRKQIANTKSAWLKLLSNQIVSTKQLNKLANKNEIFSKIVQQNIGKSVIKKQLSDAFTKIKIVTNVNKQTKPYYLKCVKIFEILINRLIKSNSRTAFTKLTAMRFYKNPTYKIKSSVKILSKFFKQRMTTAFYYCKFSTKIVSPQQESAKKISRSGSRNARSGSTNARSTSIKQSPAKKVQQPDLSILNNKISQQLDVKQKLVFKTEELTHLSKLEEQIQKTITIQLSKQNELKKKLSQKKSILRQTQIKEAQQVADDQIRAHPNDSIFFQKLRNIYLNLKHVDDEILNTKIFISQNQIDFKSLFEHSEYILFKNRELKAEVKRIQQVICPSTSHQTYKVRKQIDDIRQELEKQNAVLRKAVSKYVNSAYDIQWLYQATQKLQDQLNSKVQTQLQ